MRKLKHAEILRLDASELVSTRRHPIVVVIENVRSLYNVGSILRTCDAALVESVITTGYSARPDHPKIHKTALGAQDTVPWTTAGDATEAIFDLKARGYTIAVLEITDEPMRISDIGQDRFPIAVIVGNELGGVSDAVIEAADFAIEIPQYGAKQSLNVAVALGICVMGLVDRFRSFDD